MQDLIYVTPSISYKPSIIVLNHCTIVYHNYISSKQIPIIKTESINDIRSKSLLSQSFPTEVYPKLLFKLKHRYDHWLPLIIEKTLKLITDDEKGTKRCHI